jgi:predicted PurR-regulated permease PerM
VYSAPALLSTKDATTVSRLLTVVGIVVVITGLYFGRRVIIPLALAVVLAFLLTPIVEFLEHCRLPRVPSVLSVVVLAFAMLAAVGWGVSNQVVQVMVHLSDYRDNIHAKIQALRKPGNSGFSQATATVNDLSKELTSASQAAGAKQTINKGAKEPIPVQVAAPPRNFNEYLRDIIGPVSGVLETIGIVVIFTLFVLVKREDLRNRVFRLAGTGQLNVMTQAIDEASEGLSRYLLFQFVVNASYGLLFGLGLYFIGIPNPLLWGVICFLMRYIPYVGTLVAALLPMAMALAVFPGWKQAGLTLVLFAFLEIITANLVEPWLYGAHTGASSLAILVAAIFWGALWGPIGLILSTPLTMCLILAGKYVPQLGFLEIILGDEPVLSPAEHFYQRLLALDSEEAGERAVRYLKENDLTTLYDSVLIPALCLEEQDRQVHALDDARMNFIFQSTRELMDEVFEVTLDTKNVCEKEGSEELTASRPSGLTITCVPSKDEADEISGAMLAQVLRTAGHEAHALELGPVSTMLKELERMPGEVICVSALPPFATGQARSLCKQLRQCCPKVKLILGLWAFAGGAEKAQEKMGLNCADAVATSLAQVVSFVDQPNFINRRTTSWKTSQLEHREG